MKCPGQTPVHVSIPPYHKPHHLTYSAMPDAWMYVKTWHNTSLKHGMTWLHVLAAVGISDTPKIDRKQAGKTSLDQVHGRPKGKEPVILENCIALVDGMPVHCSGSISSCYIRYQKDVPGTLSKHATSATVDFKNCHLQQVCAKDASLLMLGTRAPADLACAPITT